MLSLVFIFLNTYSGDDSITIQLKEESFGLFFDTNFISLDPNTYYIPLTLCPNYRVKDVSEFTHSNWITLSCYSSPKHKSLFHR